MWKSSWPSAVSRSITSPSTGGYNASHQNSSKQLDLVATVSGIAGSLMRPISRLPECGGTCTEQYSNNRIENDHGRLKARLRPMRGLSTDRAASIVIKGHAFIQNLRRGHYELGVEASNERLRVAAAFDELATVI